jgi:hypothetical protein
MIMSRLTAGDARWAVKRDMIMKQRRRVEELQVIAPDGPG